MRKTIGSVSALIALSAATASAEIRAAPFSNIGLDISYDYQALLDMDGDSNDDFEVWRNGGYDILSTISFHEVVVDDLDARLCTRFAFGASIGPSGITDTGGFWTNWVGLGRGYAGVKLVREGTTNWGWIEFYLPDFSTGMVVRGAWETIAGKSIPAGVWPGDVVPSNGPFAGGNTVVITNGLILGTITNVTVGGVTAPIQDSGTNWVRITMPATGSAGAKALVIETVGGDRLQVDGYTVNPAGVIVAYGPEIGGWDEVEGLPVGEEYLAAGTLNGALYSVGGMSGVGGYSGFFRYDGTNWTSAGGLPQPTYGLAVAEYSNALYAMGGVVGASIVTNVYRFDGTNWTEVAGLPFLGAHGGAAVWNGGLYWIGGYGGPGTNVCRYDGTAWTEVNGLPAGRTRLTANVLNGVLYAIGGASVGDEISTTNVYRYDGTNWTEVAGLPESMFLTASGVLNGGLYVFGDMRNASVGRTNVYRFDGTTWAVAAGLPTGRFGAGGSVFNGALYSVGGFAVISPDGNSSGPSTNVYRSFLIESSAVNPSGGAWGGGYPVVITGLNLGDGADITNVTLCGVSVASIVSQSATQVVVVAGGAFSVGLGDVRIFSTSFGETVKSNAFEVRGSTLWTDYDGDHVSDMAVCHATNGDWYIRKVDGDVLCWATNFGNARVVTVPGDYDGDGAADLAVYDYTRGNWYAKKLTGEVLMWRTNWGFAGALPVAGDYDGDGVFDLAVYDEADGNWYVRTVAGQVLVVGENWGFAGAMPVAGDYNGDGTADLAVYDRERGNWYVRTIQGAVLAEGTNWGFAGATPVPGDYDADGTSDQAVYDEAQGNWYIRSFNGPILLLAENWGFWGAVPVPGDYDGDGFADLAVYGADGLAIPAGFVGNWYIRRLAGEVLLLHGNWGSTNFVPVNGE